MTGEAKYLDWIRRELPADLDGLRTWGWVTTGPWLHAFFALANVTDARLDDATRARARAAVIRWAEAETGVDGKDYAAPFGAPLPRAVEHRLGWYFSNTFASMLALGLTGDDKYRDRIIRSWNYLLGTNAMNRSFFTGIGDADHRPHWLAHEVSYVAVSRLLLGDPAGWPDVAPGLPTADVQMGTYPPYYSDAWNQQRAARQFPPAGASYPILDRTTDAWNTDNEFTIERQTQQIASLVPIFVETGSGRSAAPAGR